MKAELSGLYALTPDWPDGARLLAVTETLLMAGCRLLQYRSKSGAPLLRLQHALALRELTYRHEALLIINDDVALALASSADGVHLGSEDGELSEARTRLGPDKIIGATCYQDLGLADAAAQAGADYVAFGSFHASPTKPQASRAAPALLAEARQRTGLPVCAIGGITTDNAAPLLAAGANLLAVISALYEAPDPAAACRHFIRLFEETHA